MAKLKSRDRQIPNNFRFYQPQTGWQSKRFASFNAIVDALVAHRKANPAACTKHNLSTDPKLVADEIDRYNANFCQRMGWTEYIVTDGGQSAAVPFTSTSLPSKLGRLAVGGAVILDWLKDGAEAVPASLSSERAKTCSLCPLNAKGDWTAFFTQKVSSAIREALNQRRNWNLSTPYDDELKVCSACDCPIPLKVHMPIERVVSRISNESKKALHPACWIKSEGGL